MDEINKTCLLHEILNLTRGLYKAIDEDWRKCAAKSGLTVSQQHLLWILYFENGSTLSQISEYGIWHLSTVIDLVERMERFGMVRKETDVKDARTKRVYITDKGKKMLKISWNNKDNFKFIDALNLGNKELVQQYFDTLYRLNRLFNGEKFVQYVQKSTKKLRNKLERKEL
ncbi:DNA-binding MarR family transcriptional regulator [Desulfohalotomaculum tongense]|uniref:winged helix DNA-binding protein n=1 Tax=Desulforadius tongensis TaxID=1216062 RepID=UPI001958E866|nr:winged helix DNA-binding protein [Desulforadius tongensis]MBM7855413.1 DNA-binding MarR family transcriptional regulator [Desulforadius tongensis]